MRKGLLALGIFVLLGAASTSAAVFTVTTAEDTDDGVCDAQCSLREAVEAANADDVLDTIELPEGVLRLTRGVVEVNHSTTIVGLGTDRTVIDGGGNDRIFDLASGSFMIVDVTLRGGKVTDDGGAILVRSTAVLNASGVAFVANHAAEGGALFASGGLLVADCTFAANSADMVGGGVGLNLGVSAEIVRSTFLANTSEDGSAIYAPRDSTLSVGESLFAANRAERGGAVGTNWATLTFANDTFSANAAAMTRGGAFFLNAGTLAIRNCTLTDNTDAGGYSAIYHTTSPVITVENTVFDADGPLPECKPAIVSAGHNLDAQGTCGLSDPTDVVGLAAGLGPLRNNGGPTLTHALLRGSPAIDAGGGSFAAADQRGIDRPIGTGPDMGAYEADGSEPPVGTPLLVPVIAHVAGVGGTPWHSDVALANPSEQPLQLALRYSPGGDDPTTRSIALVPHGSVLLEDLVTSAFGLGDGRGGLEVIPPLAGPVPVVLSRTFAVSGGERLGQGMPALLPMPSDTYYIAGLVEDDAYRSNVGLTAGDEDVVVQIDLFRGGDGAVGSTFAQNLSAHSQAQWRLPVMFPGLAQAGIPMTARIRLFGPAAPYGSLADQKSSDAVTLVAQRAGNVWIVPIVAHNPGGDLTFWRSDLFLHNPNPIPARVELEFLPEATDNASGGQVAAPVTVSAYGTMTFADVAGTLFGVTNGKGSLSVVGSPPIVVTSRTYTTREGGGTYGLGVPAVPPFNLTPRRKVVAGIRTTGGYRTNIGFVGGHATETIALTLRDADGTALASGSVQVPPRSMTQRSMAQLFAVPLDALSLGSVDVAATSQPLLVYVSTADGSSQDPIYDVVAPVP